MRRDPESENETGSGSEPFWRWPAAVFDLFESSEDRAYGALVRALAHQLAAEEGTALEMDTTARRPMGDVVESERETEADIMEEARRRLGTFRVALEDAYARSGGDPRREVSFDAADPQQDAAVDTLIQYLVRTGFAEVRTEEPQPGHYVYALTVDWARLRQLAETTGHPLPLGGA
jgi:hypothetical protein